MKKNLDMDEEIWFRRLELPHSPDYDLFRELNEERKFGPWPDPDRELDYDRDYDIDTEDHFDDEVDRLVEEAEDYWLENHC